MIRALRAGTPRALLLGGFAAFALGAALAFAFLPEWRGAPPAAPEAFEHRFAALARRLGLSLAGGRPKVELDVDSEALGKTYRDRGEKAADALARSRSAVRIRVSQPLGDPHPGLNPRLSAGFSTDGQLLRLTLREAQVDFFRASDPQAYSQLIDAFERALLAPGERLEAPLAADRPKAGLRRIVPSDPPQALEVQFVPPLLVEAERTLATRPLGREAGGRILARTVVTFTRVGLVLLVVFGAFFALLARRDLDLWNAVLLAALLAATSDPSWIADIPASPGLALGTLLVSAAGRFLWVLVTWSAGESLLRVSHPGFTTSLDNLRRGRLGPRGGRALLSGLGCGAGLAGLKLGLGALAVLLPGTSPAAASLDVPLFRISGSPIGDGILLAAHTLLALGLAARFLPPRWIYPATALALAATLDLLPLHPGAAGFVACALLAALLTWAARRLGVTTLLVAAIVSYLLPATLFAIPYASWMPGSLALCAAALVALGSSGFAGLSRPEDRETEPLPQPAFMRRLEEERRVRYEVGLLGRMQAGLMPREMPCLPGYQVAARSVLAGDAGGDLYDFLHDEEGGLWIAAGDVAGNGYPCAVAQAMIKATLLSVIAPRETPDRVLYQVDRVLRRAHLPRRFSTLALLRLDPASGEVLLSNAGHPFPLQVAEQKLKELAVPGLPLGRGPERTFGLCTFTLPKGGLLVVYSDGLVSTLDRSGRLYGFERVREVVEVMGNRPAPEVVDALINDGRRHLDGEPAADDMTVLAIRRS